VARRLGRWKWDIPTRRSVASLTRGTVVVECKPLPRQRGQGDEDRAPPNQSLKFLTNVTNIALARSCHSSLSFNPLPARAVLCCPALFSPCLPLRSMFKLLFPRRISVGLEECLRIQGVAIRAPAFWLAFTACGPPFLRPIIAQITHSRRPCPSRTRGA